MFDSCLGFAFNRQTIFDSLAHTLVRSGDVDEVLPDEQSGSFNLIESFHIATAIISSTSTLSMFNTSNDDMSLSTVSTTLQVNNLPMIEHIYHQEQITPSNVLRPQMSMSARLSFDWFYKFFKHIGIRGLIISSTISICFLFVLVFVILHLHCKHRHTVRNLAYPYSPNHGKAYSQMQRSSYVSATAGQQSKKHVPKLLRYLHRNQSKASSPSSFRLTSNGSLARLNSGDSYHLISSIQEKQRSVKSAVNCTLNNHCYIHSTFSQPMASSPSLYHQVNRLMLSGGGEPPLPQCHLTSCQPSSTATLRSLRKDIDHSSSQAYSAVYSCDLAANLDHDHECSSPMRSADKRRSILKTNSILSGHNPMIYLFMKNLVDCYAVQFNQHQTMLLATADDNRIQLFHARVSQNRDVHRQYETNRQDIEIVIVDRRRTVLFILFSFSTFIFLSVFACLHRFFYLINVRSRSYRSFSNELCRCHNRDSIT
jgi:hypothetical protein